MISLDQILIGIKPSVLKWIQELTAAPGGAAPSVHALDSTYHSGTLADSQAPQFLLRSGGRSVTGNLSVEPGVTIDGVDLSIFYADYGAHILNPNAHHAAFIGLIGDDTGLATPDGAAHVLISGGVGLTSAASTNTLTINLDTPGTLSVTSGNVATSPHTHAVMSSSNPGAAASLLATSISGGITLDTDLWVVDASNNRVGVGMNPNGARLDVTGAFGEAALRVQSPNTIAPAIEFKASSLTSASLVKATLPADRPLVESYSGSETQPRLQLYTYGLLMGSGSATPDVMFRRGGSQHAILDNNGLGGAVDFSVSRTITAGATTPGPALINSIWAGGAQLRLGYDAANYMDFLIDNGGSLTMNPTGDLILDPGGNDVRPLNNYDVNLGLINKKWLSLHAAELVVETLVAQSTIATIGGRILVGPTTTLTSDLPASGSGTTTPPTFVAASALATADTSTSVSQTPPAGTSSGMLMLAHVTSRGNAQTFTTPSGWTLVPNTTVRDTSTTPDNDSVVFYKLAGANETTPYTFTASVSGTLGVVISVWSGVDPTSPINASASQSNASSNSITAPSITTTVANTRLVMLVGGATTKLITPPASMTEVWETSGGGSTVNSWGSHEAYTSTGSTGTRIAIYTDGSLRTSVGILIALTPTPASGGTSITVKHNQLINGDTVYMEANGKVEFMRITSAASGTGPYTYSVTRDLDGTGANDWYAGDALFNTGQATNGFIDLYSLRGVKSASQAGPTIVGNVRNSQTFNDWSEHWAIGNLNGLYDYASNVYGFAAGKYTGASGTTPWISVDATNGFRVMRGSTKLGQWDTGGDITVGQVASGKGNVLIDSGGVRTRTGTTPKIDIQNDGDVFVGNNLLAPATTFLSIFSMAQTYNGEAMAAGDILLGDNSTNKANLKWTPADGRMRFRGGTTTQAYIATDGSFVSGTDQLVINASGMRLTTQTSSYAPGSFTAGGILQWKTTSGALTATIGSTLQSSIYTSYGLLIDVPENAGGTQGNPAYIKLRVQGESGYADTSIEITKSRTGSYYYRYINLNGDVWLNGQLYAQGNIYPGNQTTQSLTFSTNSFGWGLGDALWTPQNFIASGFIGCANWFRSHGATGWYNQTYTGGIWMQNASNIEVYGGKNWYVPTGLVGYGVAPESNKRLVINGQNDSANYHGIVVRNSSGVNRLYVGNDGTQNWVNSAWQIGSDKSLKKDIRKLDKGDRRGKNIEIVEYVRKEGNGRKEIGLIAQDVQKIYPEAVVKAEDGTLAVIYADVELAMIHDLRVEIQTLWDEITKLRNRT